MGLAIPVYTKVAVPLSSFTFHNAYDRYAGRRFYRCHCLGCPSPSSAGCYIYADPKHRPFEVSLVTMAECKCSDTPKIVVVVQSTVILVQALVLLYTYCRRFCCCGSRV